MKLCIGLAAFAVAALLVLVLAPGSAANGDGVQVYLGYQPRVSNWGPFDAGGEAYINTGEGKAHVRVRGLVAQEGLQYQVWLIPVAEGQPLVSLGYFQVDAAGEADVYLRQEGLPPIEYRYLAITAEPDPDPDPEPTRDRVTIAGVLPNVRAIPIDRLPGLSEIIEGQAAPPATTSGGGAAVEPDAAGGSIEGARASGLEEGPPPELLPVTGVAEGLATGWPVKAGAVLGLTLAALASTRILREESRR